MTKIRRSIRPKLDFFGQMIRATYLELFLLWIVLNVAFTAFYFLLTTLYAHHGLNIPLSASVWVRLYDCFYFSVATATTLGYGDIIPLGASKMLTITEASIGVMLFTLFIAKLASEERKK